jgi:putative PIN family toxin of toxin-antitoxin system
VVSALLFRNGRLAWLRSAWQSRQIVPVVCTATVEELLRVLAYPKFRLDRDSIDELLAEFLPYAETVALPEHPPQGPRCRDPHDQVFIDLAIAADAKGIVTGDQDLIALSGRMRIPIRPPARWRETVRVD